MEFFERAHVVKKDSTKKENKSEEAVKKQLKQMLYGYKLSDKELIKKSANITNDFDDSSSVSGFSDLDLTASSIEDNVPQDAVGPDVDNESISEIEEVSSRQSPKNVDTIRIESDLNYDSDESSIRRLESIPEHDEDTQSFSEDASPEVNRNPYMDTSEDISIISSLLETATDISESSEKFDADGALASKILKRLGKVDNETGKQKNKKIKFKTETKNTDEPVESKNRDIKQLLNLKTLEDIDFESDHDIEDSDYSDIVSDPAETLSPPFVTVEASDINCESFEEILGEYRHPTVKNMPSESQNILLSTNNSGIFSAEDMTLEDAHIEDIDSLIPELDDNETMDDIELDAAVVTDPEVYNKENEIPNDEITSLYDDTILSEVENESKDSFMVNPIRVFYGKNNCIFVLKHPTELFIHGKVRVAALGGTVEVFGYTLQNEPCDIYAPNQNYAHCLKTVASENAYQGLFGKLTSAGLSVSEAEEIVVTLGEYDGVISLQPLKDRVIDFVESNFTATDLFSKQNKNIENCFKKVSDYLKCSLYLSRPFKCFEEDKVWEKILRSAQGKHTRGIVCGGKNVGKSTFLRYYVNKMLEHGPILVIDLDPGQAELTVAGNVSATVVTKPLVGPNFTHLKKPEIMLNIGMINVMDNTQRYKTAVEQLISHCNNHPTLSKLPWIVNTMGMVNTMGLKIMALTILHTQPTFLLQIDAKSANKRFETHLYSNVIRNLYYKFGNTQMFRNVLCPDDLDYLFFVTNVSDSAVRGKSSLAPRDERYLNFLAYFGQLASAARGDVGLLGITPYEVSLRDLNIALNVKINEDALTKVINGKVIALCQVTVHHDNKMFTLDDKPLLCHGHGIIRGIDYDKEVLYILTPTPVEQLSAVNTLVYADWVPELRGQEKHLPEGLAVPYRTATMYHQRQLMFAPRRRFNPMQLLKMSRNS